MLKSWCNLTVGKPLRRLTAPSGSILSVTISVCWSFLYDFYPKSLCRTELCSCCHCSFHWGARKVLSALFRWSKGELIWGFLFLQNSWLVTRYLWAFVLFHTNVVCFSVGLSLPRQAWYSVVFVFCFFECSWFTILYVSGVQHSSSRFSKVIFHLKLL